MSKLATLIMGPRYPLIKKDQKKKNYEIQFSTDSKLNDEIKKIN
jgi:hypothetical protein